MNSAVIVGRAGQDAEIKYYESGRSRATFSLAVNHWDGKTKSNVTDWFSIEAWSSPEGRRKLADFAGNYVKKGGLVAVDGRITSNKWQDASGENRERYLISATDIRLLGSKNDSEMQ